MRKYHLIGISILSVFILCSLSYQPIIADTPIETIGQVKESKVSVDRLNRYREVYNRIVEIKSQLEYDCECEETKDWGFPLSGLLLEGIMFVVISYIILMEGFGYNPVIMLILVSSIWNLGDTLSCDWANPFP